MKMQNDINRYVTEFVSDMTSQGWSLSMGTMNTGSMLDMIRGKEVARLSRKEGSEAVDGFGLDTFQYEDWSMTTAQAATPTAPLSRGAFTEKWTQRLYRLDPCNRASVKVYGNREEALEAHSKRQERARNRKEETRPLTGRTLAKAMAIMAGRLGRKRIPNDVTMTRTGQCWMLESKSLQKRVYLH